MAALTATLRPWRAAPPNSGRPHGVDRGRPIPPDTFKQAQASPPIPRVALDFVDPDMPRTVFYEHVLAALRTQPGFSTTTEGAELLFPAEDTSVETNWPRYARPETAYVRGSFDQARHERYLQRLAATSRRLCLINMHPFIRVPQMMCERPHVITADINLLTWERALNPRTISMPALPVTPGQFDPGAKSILAGFRGVDSHPCRRALAALDNGTTIRAELVARQNHFGRLDATAGLSDPAYTALMAASLFAFVPRGDAEFSYRLLEAMSFGCIPIVIADGLVLPFDRLVPWADISLHMPEAKVADLPAFLSQVSPSRIAAMQRGVVDAYQTHFADMQRIIGALLREVDMIVASSEADG